MAYSVENQRFIKVNKASLDGNYLGINNRVWRAASRDLGGTGLILYLYFASNMNGFKFAFSPANVIRETGIGKTSVYKYFDIMIKKGYLVPCNGNTYIFNEVPVAKNAERTESPFTKNELKPENSTSCEKTFPQNEITNSQNNREIYNKYDTNNRINNTGNSQAKAPKPLFKF